MEILVQTIIVITTLMISFVAMNLVNIKKKGKVQTGLLGKVCKQR